MNYEPITPNEPTLYYQGQLTFWGIFIKFQSDCETMYRAKGWAPSTKEQNISKVKNIICPHLHAHNLKAIGDYSRQDFDNAIKEIISSGKKRGSSKSNQYEKSTIEDFERLIRTIVTVAFENGKTLFNVYANDLDETKKNQLLEYYRLHNIQPKSFSVSQELAIAQYLSKTCLEQGESVGLLLMFALGLRCSEATGASFHDIIDIEGYPDFHCLQILNTTGINDNALHIGGKNENASRLVPLPESVYQMLLQIKQTRLNALQPLSLDPQNMVLPIVCKGTDFLNRCDTPTLSRAGAKMFSAIGMRKEFILAIKLSIEQEDFAARELSAEEEFDLVEREPTAYALRRNNATHLYNIGLNDNQTAYIMGHKIYDGQVQQKDYSSPALLYEIKQKMELRPILNPIPQYIPVRSIETQQVVNISNVQEKTIHVPSHSFASITATPFVPGDNVSINIIPESANNNIRTWNCKYIQDHSPQVRKANIVRIYHKMYKDIIHDYVIGL